MNRDYKQSVVVIISHVNSSRTIAGCLNHLIHQDYPQTLIQIIVVDGGSTDSSIEIVKRMESQVIHQVVKPGCSEAEGQSIGIHLSKSDIIMFTNSDIYVPADWISKHVEWLNKGYDLVGGKVFWGGDKFALTWNMPAPKTPQFVQQQGLGLGFSNCSVRRDFLEKVGGLRNLSSQHDTEFTFRVIRSGGKMILDPGIEVYHDHPFKSSRYSFTRSMGYALNHLIVMKASYGRIVSGSGSPAMLPVSSLIKEWIAINGTRAYRESYQQAAVNKIQINLLHFLLIRLFSTKLGQALGVFEGAIRSKVTLGSIANLHTKTDGN